MAIFGATSAIAEQVARLYATEGAHLFLVARCASRLEMIARDLDVRGASSCATHVLNLDDISQFDSVLEACATAIGAPDRVLLAYGTLPDQKEVERNPALAAKHLHTNFISPAILLNSLADKLSPGAAIAVITSVAGDRGRQSNYVYGAAKGGLSRFAEGLRHRLAAKGVRVLDIRPGFVDTPMTDQIAKTGPLWAKAERIARDIKKSLEQRAGVVYTPWYWRVVMAAVRQMPDRLFHKTKL